MAFTPYNPTKGTTPAAAAPAASSGFTPYNPGGNAQAPGKTGGFANVADSIQKTGLLPQSGLGKAYSNFGTGLIKGIAQAGLNTVTNIGGKLLTGEQNLIDKAMGKTGAPSLVAPIFTPGSDKNAQANKKLEAGEGQGLGKAIGSVVPYVIPSGEVEGLTEALSSKVPGALEKYAPQLAEKATQIATKAGQLGVKSAVEGLSNYGIALATGNDKKEAKSIGITSAILPGVGFGLNALREPVSKLFAKGGAEMINSLIKPLGKDLAYGKDPAAGVIKAGIKANSMEDLVSKIGGALTKTGQDIGTINELVDGKVTFDGSRAVSKLDAAMGDAAKKNDQTVFNRLKDVKDAITQNLSNVGGQIASAGEKDLTNLSAQAMFDLKKTIGEMTKFTGNPSDDKAVNSTLKSVYGTLKEMYNSGVAKVDKNLGKQLIEHNEDFANLMSANTAAKYREVLDKRANLVSMAGHFGLAGGLMYSLATGDLKGVAGGLLSEIASKVAGSTAVKTRVAQFLTAISEKDASEIMNQSPTLKRIFGEFSPLAKKEAVAPATDVAGVYKTGERYPALPAPAPGSPQASNNVPINLSAKAPSSAEASERANMKINTQPDSRQVAQPPAPLGLPSPGQSAIQMPAGGTAFNKKLKDLGLDEVLGGKIKNTADRRRAIKILKDLGL